MVEIRFHVPGSTTKEAGSDAGSGEENGEEEKEISAAQAFHDLVKEKADLGEVSGDIIVNFEDILVVTPRGRYDVDMFPEFLRLRGKTYDYKITYDGISRLFLLPKDDQQVLFIVCFFKRYLCLFLLKYLAWTYKSHKTRADTISVPHNAI